MPRSAAISCVIASGNPYVSYSSNAAAPLTPGAAALPLPLPPLPRAAARGQHLA